MLIRQWSGQRSLNYMASEQMKTNDVIKVLLIKVVDTFRMNSEYDDDLTTSVDNAFHSGIGVT